MKKLLLFVALLFVACGDDVVGVPEPVIQEGTLRTSHYNSSTIPMSPHTGRYLELPISGDGIYHAELMLGSGNGTWLSYVDCAKLIFHNAGVSSTIYSAASIESKIVESDKITFKIVDIDNLLIGKYYRIVAYR